MIPLFPGRRMTVCDSNAGQATRLVGALTAVPRLVRPFGVDPATVLAAAGLEPAALDRPSNRIPYAGFARLLQEAAARTGCAHFGLLAGGAWHLADLAAPGAIIRHSPTVGQGLEEFVVHQHLNNEGGVAFLVRRDGYADPGYAIHVPLDFSAAPVYDGGMAAAANFLRDLCGEEWNPSEVLLPRSAPVNPAPYRQFFRAPVRFSAEFAAVRFPEAMLAHPVAGADPGELARARAQVSAAGKATVMHQASRALRTLLLHGKGSGDDVAQALALHRRTLDRRLSAEGTTFQRVLDGVRDAVAREHLRDSNLSIAEIAASLGYADYVSFTRAFKRWTGTTPGAWREAARHQARR
jgi:AraC-like DNA-binding protein